MGRGKREKVSIESEVEKSRSAVQVKGDGVNEIIETILRALVKDAAAREKRGLSATGRS